MTETHRGYCVKCEATCGVEYEVESGRLAAVRPDRLHPNGGICAMGKAAAEIADPKRRITRPMRRTNEKGVKGRWAPITWDAALTEVAAMVRAVQERHGDPSLAFLRPTTSANAAGDWAPYLSKLAALLRTPNLLTPSYMCQWIRDHGLRHVYGTGLPTPDIGRSNLVLIFGHNPAVTNPQLLGELRDARRRGAIVVVVDPRESETTKFADLWLAPEYGTDGALIMGAIRRLMGRGGYDKSFVHAWTNADYSVDRETGRASPTNDGSAPQSENRSVWDLLLQRTEPFNVTHVAQATGIALVDIEQFYDYIETVTPVSYYTWNGWEQHRNAFETHRAMACLYALTGCLDAPGGNVAFRDLSERGDAVWGVAATAPSVAQALSPLGPSATAPSMYRAMLEGEPYPVRGLVAFGGNLITQHPDAELARQALASLDFHVQVDIRETPMADFADLLLPAAVESESPRLKTGFGGSREAAFHVQYVPAAHDPPDEARPDLRIIFDLALELDLSERFWSGNIEASFAERVAVFGLSMEQLTRNPSGVTVESETTFRKYADVSDGATIGFPTPSGKVELYSNTLLDVGIDPLPRYEPPDPVSGDERAARRYPLRLTSIKLVGGVHSQHRDVPSLRRRWPEPFVEIHPETAAHHGVGEGDWIRVSTPHASMRVVARLTTRVKPSALVGHAGWWDGCNELSLPGYDPFSDDGSNLNRLIPSGASHQVFGSSPLKWFPCRVDPVSE